MLFKKKCYLINLIIIFFIQIFVLKFCLQYEVNDDGGLQWFMSQSDSTFSPYTHQMGFMIVKWLNIHFRVISWHAVFLIVGNLISIMFLSYILLREIEKYAKLDMVIALSVFDVCICFCLLYLNWTRTAALLGMTAVALLWKGNIKIIKVAAVVLLIYGSFIRLMEVELSAFITLLLLVLCDIFISGKLQVERGVLVKACKTGLLILSVLVVCRVTDKIMTSPEKRFFSDLTHQRGLIVDFPDKLLPYEGNEELYAQYGINSKDDLSDIQRWIFGDWEKYSYDNLKGINSNCRSTNYSMVNIFRCGLRFWRVVSTTIWKWMFVIFIISIFVNRNKLSLLMTIFSVDMLVVLAFAIVGRAAPRTLDFCAVLTTFLCILSWDSREDELISQKRIALVMLALSGTLEVASLGYSYYNALNNEEFVKEGQLVKTARGIIANDKEHFYLLTNGNKVLSMNYMSVLEPFPDFFQYNCLPLGGWGERAPFFKARMEQYGIDDPMKALVENENVYTIYDEAVYEHLKRNYYPKLSIRKIYELDGVGEVIQYYSN